jgi:hypothetical protein
MNSLPGGLSKWVARTGGAAEKTYRAEQDNSLPEIFPGETDRLQIC